MYLVAIKIKTLRGAVFAFDSEFESRRALAEFLLKFRKAHRRVPRSSVSVFGMLYKHGSLEWLASHSCEIMIGGQGPRIRRFKFIAPANLPRAGIWYLK